MANFHTILAYNMSFYRLFASRNANLELLTSVSVHGWSSRKFKRGIGSLFDPVLTLWGGGHIGSSRMEQSYCTSGFFRQRVTARNHSNYQPTPSTEVSSRMISAKTHVVKSASRCA